MRIERIIITVLVILGSFTAGFGQNGQPAGIVKDESKSGTDLYTGRNDFSLPLDISNGRGESSVPITLSIPQPQFQIYESERFYNPQGILTSINYSVGSASTGNPYSLDAGIYVGNQARIRITPQSVTGFGNSIHLTTLQFVTNSGETIDLRDTATNGQPFVATFSLMTPSLTTCHIEYYAMIAGSNFPQPITPVPVPNCSRGKIFHSTDGSNITFVADENIYDAFYANNALTTSSFFPDGGFYGKASGTLYFPNGTKYRFDILEPPPPTIIIPILNRPDNHGGVAKLSWVMDKNGNKTVINYNTDPTRCNYDPFNLQIEPSCYKPEKIIDSLNRESKLIYSTFLGLDRIEHKGFGGSNKAVSIVREDLSVALRPDQTLKTPHQLFPSVGNVPITASLTNLQIAELDKYKKTDSSNGVVEEAHNPKVISAVVLPNNQRYTFKYTSYGELARVISPLGSYIDFEYGPTNHPNTDGLGVLSSIGYTSNHPVPYQMYRRVIERKTFDSSGVLQTKTTYSNVGGMAPVTVTTFDGSQSILAAEKHYFFTEDFAAILFPGILPYEQHISWKVNKEYKTEVLDINNLSTVLRRTESVWGQREPVSWWRPLSHPDCTYVYGTINPGCFDPEPINDPRVTEVKSTLETGQITKKKFTYDQFNNVTDTYEYDYSDGQTWQLLRRSHTDFITDPNYTSYTGAYLTGLPWQSWVSSDAEGNNRTALSQIEYDNYGTNPLFSRSNVSGHDSVNYSSANFRRGNPTKVTSFSDVNNSSTAISSQTQFDILGNVIKTIDPKGNISTIDYSDSFGSPDSEARTNNFPSQLNGKNTFAFATSATNSLGTSFSQVDYFSGNTVDTEDINGNTSTAFFNDILDRPTQTVSANNRSNFRSQTTITYNDDAKTVTATSDLYTFGDNLSKGVSIYDSLGRTTEARSYEIGGYTVTAKPQYDALGRVIKTTNPYRPYLNEQPVWTTTEYDVLGRVAKIITPDLQEATTTYNGNVTTVTDQAGKKRRSITNALGQLTRIDEPDNNNNLGTLTSPTQPTYYTYNTNGQMVKVNQGQQNRYFLYDSIGRLIRVRQPEQNTNANLTLPDSITGNNLWSTGSTYDLNGNPLTSTDAKGITVTQTYDNLNRPLIRSYSDGTPTVTNTYDGAGIPNSKGQLTKISSSISTTENTAFDIVGKVLSHKQITDGQTYNTAYNYNLTGALIEETYPSGRIVKNMLDSDGRLAAVSSKTTAQTDYRNYAGNFVYAASGAVTQMRYGNGRWESAQFNQRLQVTQIGLGSSQNTTNLWKTNYAYGEIDANDNLNEGKNNGSVARQTTNFSGLANPFVQSYKYDSLNRLTEAKEINGTTQTFKQNFGYDRFGNRTSFNQLIGTTQTNQTPAIDPANNRFTTGQGFTYDFDGNLIADNLGRSFTFNGDNKQTQVKTATNDVIGTYQYDGTGARVKKITASETTIFVYNAGGKLLAEYSTQTAANPTISYLTQDNLGSPRVITDNGGNVSSRRDFMPFGEELNANNATNRLTNQKYSFGEDNVRKRFTGYEKDQETGLDFAEARYYNNLHGRFTAVDPMLASGLSSNPQTFNRYAYVSNNPTNAADPTGLNAVYAFSLGIYAGGAGTGDPYSSSPFMNLPELERVAQAEHSHLQAAAATPAATAATPAPAQQTQQQATTQTITVATMVVHPSCMNAGRCAATVENFVTLSVTVDSVSVGLNSDRTGVSALAELTFTATDQNGGLTGSVTEQVSGTEDFGGGPQPTKITTSPDPVRLDNGQFIDYVDTRGFNDGSGNMVNLINAIETSVTVRVDQNATFSIKPSNPYQATGIITFVHTRGLGNFSRNPTDGRNTINPRTNGTIFRFSPSTLRP
jgi:RHS repeat-associated protein